MPIASVNPPAYLVHNNLAIYQTYKNDWYDDPYHYHYSISAYEQNPEIETFDIRNLPGYDKNLSHEDIIKNAIDNRELPVFKEPQDVQKEYMMDEDIGFVTTTKEQDACFELADLLQAKLMDSGNLDALCLPAQFNMFQKTLFLIPEMTMNDMFPHYSLYVFQGNASWQDFRTKEPLKAVSTDRFFGNSGIKAVCAAMDVPYPAPFIQKKEVLSDKIHAAEKQTAVSHSKIDQTKEKMH